MGHKISKEQIDPGVKDYIMSFVGDINELETDDKSNIINAVNSLMVDRVDNAENIGKLANAIGEPVTANHSVDEVVEGLGEMLNTFKTNMMNSGVVVESSDKFKALIDKIKGLTEGGGNKGTQFAEGSIDVDQTYRFENINSTHTFNFSSKLDFTPNYIFVRVPGVRSTTTSYGTVDVSNAIITNKFNSRFGNILGIGSNDLELYVQSVTANGFTVKGDTSVNFGDSSYSDYYGTNKLEWCAIGVGEQQEDNTLRDSLASILEEEGVSVTEEDDMASLIIKTDNEFAENTNKLYNLMLDGGYNVNNTMNMDRLLEILELNGINIGSIKQIACGEYHTFILKNDGSVWCCGYDYYSQLGKGTTNNLDPNPYFTKVLDNVKQIVCGGNHTFILKNDGSLYSCGRNNYGQLGLGDTETYTSFTQVTTNINNDVSQIACGYDFTFILKNDGSVYSCGRNNYGQLGLGNTTDKTSFTQVTTNINNDVKEIHCGYNHAIILKNDGTVWGCGYNSYGQLGLSSVEEVNVFTEITVSGTNTSGVKDIKCGSYHTLVLYNDGKLMVSGRNNYGQLGLGDTNNRTAFTQVTTNMNNDVEQIACGYNFTMIIKNDGSLWSCGHNSNGQLGLGVSGSNSSSSTFTQVTTNINNDVKEIECGCNFTYVIKKDGSIWSCGHNNYGELGLGTSGSSANKTTFTQVM